MVAAPIAHLSPLVATNPAFVVVFSVFIVALVVMIVIVVVWAIRRDRIGRAAWRQRHTPEEGDLPPTPRS